MNITINVRMFKFISIKTYTRENILESLRHLKTHTFFLQLRMTMEKSTAVFDKEKAQERLSKLSGGVAVFKVCYPSLSNVCVNPHL